MGISDKLFTYIDKSSELTQSMVNEYKNSLIVIGDEKYAFIPQLNSYIGGIGVSSYEYILEMIKRIKQNAVEMKFTNADNEFYINFAYEPQSGTQYSYVTNKFFINPAGEYIRSTYFDGELRGNAYTTSYLKNTVKLWGNNFNGSNSINGNIIPAKNKTLGNKSTYFAYSYINHMLGYLHGHAFTSSYAQYSTYNYQVWIKKFNESLPANIYYPTLVEYHWSGTNITERFAYIHTSNTENIEYFIESRFNNNSGDISSSGNASNITVAIDNPRAIIKTPLLFMSDGVTGTGTLFSTLFRGNLIGTSSYAYYLWNERKINGTYFDGSNDITTAYWGNEWNFNIDDYYSTYSGASVKVHGDKDITLKLPKVIHADIYGKSTYSTTSDLSNRNYKQYINTAGGNKIYHLTFTDKSSSTFAYSYVNGNLQYNPSLNKIFASYFNGFLEGVSDQAVKLYFKRKINGTDFDGTANITTKYWGNKRDITINDNFSTYSYTVSGIDGGSNITLKLPNNINANLKGRADQAILSYSALVANRTYTTKLNNATGNNTYYVQLTNTNTGYAYTYINQYVHFNPNNRELTSTYFKAITLFRGKLRASDQWGTL